MRLSLLLLALAVLAAAKCPSKCREHGVCDGSVCNCNANWAGIDCSVPLVAVAAGQTVNGTVRMGKWAYYYVPVLSPGQEVTFAVHETDSGVVHDCDLYLQVATFPTRNSYFSKDTSLRKDSTLKVNATAARGVWYAGVYGFLGCSFQLRVTAPAVDCPDGCLQHGSCGPDGKCTCAAGYGGDNCGLSNRTLVPGTPISATVELRQWSFFYYDVEETKDKITFTMDSDKDCDLYVRHTELPSLFAFDFVNASTPAPGHRDLATLVLEQPDLGRWYAGVYGFERCAFSVRVDEAAMGTACINNCSLHGTCAGGSCACSQGFSGPACATMDAPLELGAPPTRGFVDANEWNHYNTNTDSGSNLQVRVHQRNPNADCDLYVKRGAPPNRTDFDHADLGAGADMSLDITDAGEAVWYIGVFGWQPCEYDISVSELASASDCGHGVANPTNDGCVCNDGYFGANCAEHPHPLTSGGASISGTVTPGAWRFFSLNATSVSYTVTVQETGAASGGGVYLFVQYRDIPTDQDYAAADVEQGKALHYVHLEAPTAEARLLIVGVFGSPFAASDNQQIPFKVSAFAFPTQ